ncbi:disease resistance protein Pik-2-like, partial [Triticum dicoccoides]|uniref:disease resistance protein Pik-2-like n=1 Tax=Triticum dicoccoides TaxID=85692 RepID=UPI00188FF1DA
SDRIDKFFSKLFEESSRVSLIKVLDLEGCQCFGGKNQHYLKDICSKMLLLKYLSLRGTNLTKLPSEINNLRELEVLDIRQTRVPAAATVHVILLKLKRLLAGSVVMSSGPSNNEVSYVMVPDKIEKMTNMEVMSNVKARNSNDLKDIGKLWRLRKLGVVIEQKDKLIRNLLQTICDLHECLRSLSITLPITAEDSSEDNSPKLLSFEGRCPKILESLSIRGTAETGQLFQLLTKDGDQLQLAKVTLSGTRLRQADLEILAKLPKLVCLRLQDRAYIDDKLSFNKEKFKGLKCFLIEGSEITVLSFNGGAPKLEKIILSSTDGLQSLSRVEDLNELKEVELKNSNKLSLSLFEKAKNISKVTLCRTILCQDEVEILAKMPNMRSLVLKEISYAQSLLIFYKDDFPRLNLLTIDFSVITCIGFTTQSATKLEKIIWSYRKGTLLSGIDELPKLKELEFNGDFVPDEVIDALKKHKNNPKLIHNKPENQEAGNIPEKKDAPRFPLFWKKED